MTTITNPALFPEVAAANSLSSVRGGKGDVSGKQDAAIKKTTQDFEALFIGMMLKSMRSTVGKDSLTGGGRGEEVYRSLLDQEYAQEAARGGALGLGRGLEEQLGWHIGHSEANDTRTKP
ncbi:MAG: rod-binding protein [Deltaproteobacteria bacterium]|nr:rod-binding protein [Deltaproteobacteria bacterium]